VIRNCRSTILAVALIFGSALGAPLWADATQDATLTVTPAATVSIDLSVPGYAFGAIDVNTSTNSATAVTLTNNGEVTVAVDKRILDQSNPSGWTAGATAGLDTYALYCATSTTRLSLSEFGSATKFGLQGNVSALTGPTGTQPLLPPQGAGQSVDLWFRLDMPTAVSSLAGRTITVRFTAAAQ
jgi:hypothetical protein